MDFNQASLELCERNRGKLEVTAKAPVTTRDELSTAYTPGVAEPCRKIHADASPKFYEKKASTPALRRVDEARNDIIIPRNFEEDFLF